MQCYPIFVVTLVFLVIAHLILTLINNVCFLPTCSKQSVCFIFLQSSVLMMQEVCVLQTILYLNLKCTEQEAKPSILVMSKRNPVSKSTKSNIRSIIFFLH